MAVSGSSIHLVWRDDRDGNQEIYYIRSADGGLTWGADTRLTDSTSFALNPSFAVGVGDNDLGITKDQVNTFNLIGKLLPLALLCPVNSEN
jgi:hypothetical protein